MLRMYIMLRAPTKPMAVLASIALVDLVVTAFLYQTGWIVELNPLMRPLLEHSTWVFALVKFSIVAVAYFVLQWYRRIDEEFVNRIATAGSLAYIALWTTWFLSGLILSLI